MNNADSEIMSGLLAEKGFKISKNSDLIIVNTCTVKTPTERKILKRLRELEKEGKNVIVTGCIPAAQPNIADDFRKFSFLGTNVSDIEVAVQSVLKGDRFVKISIDRELDLEKKLRSNVLVEIVPIAQGCVGNCSYCITKLARGNLKSISEEKLLTRVKKAINENVKEIWLTAQDTGAYGFDIGKNLPDLLNRISDIDGKFFVRIGMMNPNHVKKIFDGLIESYKSKKIYKFLHVPVQSGDDEILKKMNRQYTVKDFKNIVEKFREEIPDITISTDVIVGFPEENEKQFQNTIDLIMDVKPDVLNISRFWSRPGTSAEKMKQFPGRETKRRSRMMNELFRKIGLERNKRWVGWEGEVLISDVGKYSGYCARNFAYKPIILKSEKNLLGKFVKVRINDATRYDLRGEIIY